MQELPRENILECRRKLKQKLKLKQKDIKIQAIKSKLSVISLKLLRFYGKNQNSVLSFFAQSLVFDMENSSTKLNFRQIHLVHLPKPGPISKPGLDIFCAGQATKIFH